MTDSRSFRRSCGLTDLGSIRAFVREAAEALDVPADAVPDLVIAVDEAATNVIEHGYGGRPGPIEVEVERIGDDVLVHLRDEAPPFDPTAVASPDLAVPLEQRAPGGFGIHLTRASVDRVVHRRIAANGNELTLVKTLAGNGGDRG